jgi:hypothetical protein
MTALLLPILALACVDYELSGGKDPGSGTVDTAAATEPPDGPVAEIALEPLLYMQGICDMPGSDVLIIESVGEADLVVNELALGDVDLGQFEITPPSALPFAVPVGETAEVIVTWTPETGDYSSTLDAELWVRSTAYTEPEVRVAIVAENVQDDNLPSLSIAGPDCLTIYDGDPVSLVATLVAAGNPEDLIVTWESDLDGVIQKYTADADSTSTLIATLSPGEHRLTATVTDACDRAGSGSFDLTVTAPEAVYSGPAPDGLAFDDQGYLWIADFESDRLYQVDPLTLGILKALNLPGEGVDGATFMGGEMLVSFYKTNELVFVDLCDGSETGRWNAPGNGVSDVSWDGTDLWMLEYEANRIHRLDPATGASLEWFPTPIDNPNGLAYDGTYFYMTGNGTDPHLGQLDASFNEVQRYNLPGNDPRGVAWDGAEVWYSDASVWTIGSFAP